MVSLLGPYKKCLPLLFSSVKRRIYLDTQLKAELWKLPGCSLFSQVGIGWWGRTHKNVRFRSPNRLTTQSGKSPDLAVGWSAFSLLGPPFFILAGTCHMVHRWLTQRITDGQCLQMKVFSCNIRYGICTKRRSWKEKNETKKSQKNNKTFFFSMDHKITFLNWEMKWGKSLYDK